MKPMSRTHEDIQDELLVLQCQQGEAEALRALIGRWQPRLGRFAWRLTSDREAARDLTQDAWLAIVRGLKKLNDPAQFRCWAYRIVRHKCTDWTRRQVLQRRVANEMQDAAAVEAARPSLESDSPSDVGALQQAMAKLPVEQRAMLSLHYLDGMSMAEIADVLDIPTGTVKSRMFHARNRLRQAMERVAT